jgi:hypothetical protein
MPAVLEQSLDTEVRFVDFIEATDRSVVFTVALNALV